MSPGWDSVLFIGAPLVAIAALIPLARFFPSEEFGAFLLAFFTFGHHLPGFLRAYGDRELFAQHRWRFLLAPPIVFTLALWCARRDLHGLLFLVFTWDIWHVLMQQYGFLRIYDAKSGRIDTLAAWGDRAVSICWYITFIAISPHYTHNLLLRGYSAGLPALAPETLEVLRRAMIGLSAVVSVLYAGWHVRRWRRGQAPNLRKLAALACFLGATWYLYVAYADFTVGFAVWSAFHCLQYYGIVWVFNRHRVTRPGAVTRFLGFLFRPRPALVVLYAAMILAYGGINWMARELPRGLGLEILMAFIVTSGTLHYYYDGFIWRVREPETRRSLAIDAGGAAAPLLSRLRHPAFAQAAVVAAAFAALVAIELRRPYDESRVRRDLATSAPALALAQRNYGDLLRDRGHYTQAASLYSQALRLDGADAQSHHRQGLSLAALGRTDEAVAAFERALSADPALRAAHYNLASLLVRRGETRRALAHYRQAFPAGDERSLGEIEKDPEAAGALTNFGLGLLESGDRAGALEVFRRAVRLNPRHGPAQLNLASALVLANQVAEAKRHYQAAIECGDASVRAAAERALRGLR